MASINCTMSEAQVQEAFLAAQPLIASQILDLTVKHPNFMMDLPEVEEWPLGQGTIMEQIVFRGAMPQVERGFAAWKMLSNNSGCSPCDGPDCSYTWTEFGGNALERKITTLMQREFRSPSYCVSNIQTTAHFREVFAKVVENLYAQIAFFKEINVAQNILTGLAKKYVVDSTGAVPNIGDPYSYPNIGTAKLSMLNIEMLEFFYEYMRRDPSAVPYDVVNGAPIYSIMCSHQLLARLYRDDPQLRQDVRFSGLANDELMKYNFMSTIRGMFIAAPILYPRRFNIVASVPVEVLPFVNGVPGEVGVYTSFNPAYEAATHEEVILNGKYPFKLFYMNTVESLGANTSFGPEYSWFNTWSWINPLTVQDPFRRVGYFATSAKLGISQQFSDAVYGILVERPSKALMAMWLPNPACPPEDPSCDNAVPATGCPCPLILGYSANPVTAGDYFLTLAVPIDANESDEIQFGVSTGGYITGTVVALSEDGKAVEVTFDNGETVDCDLFTTIFCDNTLGCSSNVLQYAVNCADPNNLDLVLANPIKADTAADTVTLYYGDGTSDDTVTVVSVDMLTNTWVVDTGGTAFCNQVGGVISICVPPGTDATCPTCGQGPSFTQCAT